MEPLIFLLLLLLALVSGFIGAMLGLGGGIVLVPGLTLLFHQDVKVAIAVSLVSVVATSCSAAAVYAAQRFTNIRLGIVLEVATTLGALLGGLVAVYVAGKYLYFVFAGVLTYAAVNMLRGPALTEPPSGDDASSDLDGSYVDPATGKTVSYVVNALPVGLGGSLLAGVLSGMLGLGGGIIKVPLMNVVMRIPMKAAIATSNFMIGVTAATGALVYWTSAIIDLRIAAPSAIGMLIGARLGTKAARRATPRVLIIAFVVFIVFTAVQMFLRGIRAR